MDQAAIARPRLLTVSTWTRNSGEATPTVPNWQDEPDEVLLRLLAQGSKEALSSLFRRYARQVFSIGRRVLRDSTEAEDLVQEVFLYVYRRAHLYDADKGSARSWLAQVAYTQAFQRRRKLVWHGFYKSPDGDRATEVDVEGNCALYDQTVEGLFGRDGWRRMLESLTEEQRETLKLHFFEGLTFAEIAERLGQSYANVRNHHYRGLGKLRRYLAQNPLNRR